MLCGLFATSLLAETPEETGLAIAREAERRDKGFGDYTAHMLMVLRNAQGEESSRQIRVAVFEVQGDGDKSRLLFHEPADVRGTALLTFAHKQGDDDQWLYLPALKRTKRISAGAKTGSFMGSEFAYEDFGSQEIERYHYKYLRDDPCDGGSCFVLERRPVDPNSGYTRQLVWLDRSEYRPWKIEYYDRKQSLLKTLTWSGYRKFLGRYWRPTEMFMQNHQTGKSTRLKWDDYRFKVGLRAGDLNPASLGQFR